MYTAIFVGIHLLRNEQRLVSGEVEHGGGAVGWVREGPLLMRGWGELKF